MTEQFQTKLARVTMPQRESEVYAVFHTQHSARCLSPIDIEQEISELKRIRKHILRRSEQAGAEPTFGGVIGLAWRAVKDCF